MIILLDGFTKYPGVPTDSDFLKEMFTYRAMRSDPTQALADVTSYQNKFNPMRNVELYNKPEVKAFKSKMMCKTSIMQPGGILMRTNKELDSVVRVFALGYVKPFGFESNPWSDQTFAIFGIGEDTVECDNDHMIVFSSDIAASSHEYSSKDVSFSSHAIKRDKGNNNNTLSNRLSQEYVEAVGQGLKMRPQDWTSLKKALTNTKTLSGDF